MLNKLSVYGKMSAASDQVHGAWLVSAGEALGTSRSKEVSTGFYRNRSFVEMTRRK